MGTEADVGLLRNLGLTVETPTTGCCGMAGSFGFENGHYDISVKIGERKLLPAVREAPGETILIADGFSCKSQVQELTGRRMLNSAQVIKMAMEHGPDGPPGRHPEDRYPDVEPAKLRTGAALAGVAGAAAAGGGLAALARRARR